MPGLRKLLSIDGGGVRGLAAIVVLEQLMEVANAERSNKGLSPQEPWQMFDMIGGTSTGGLIAIMLGRLRMSLDECKTAYTELSGMAFTKRNILERVSGKPSLGAKFKSKSLDNAILGILEAKKDFLGASSSDALMKDEQKDCYVFVVSHLENISGTLAILRSYRNLTHPVKQFHTMKLWQACRATSAATTFFDPVDVNGSRYSDGALIYNNPVQLVHNEAGEMFPGEPTLIISLGTGIAAYKEFSPNVLNIGVQLAEIATQTDRDADAFFRQDGGKMHHLQRYFRFDIPGIGDISLDEADQLDMIKHASEKYMEIGETTVKMGMCSQQLSSGEPTLPEVPDESELQVRLDRLRS
ncbi:acyl transferase/acyl hydrolase/lysophospholipase [Calycina marina]|uniref:Acyl transferase/acyl hydrolase/lysophospholipase n=1 Tax=Calycina marina TaxID=1763456 RepID=A0A9P8CG22_9HELO|nr:acyl transferase/acyl hydrolase/lysophospholipase [Calycina marina]